MNCIAPGFYCYTSPAGTYTYFVRVGRRWKFTATWYNRYEAKEKDFFAALCAHKPGYPTLAQAISAMKGNRAS